MSLNKNTGKKAKDAPEENFSLRDSWEFKTGKFILRVAAVLFFLAYLMLAVPHASAWAWQAYYLREPLPMLKTHLEQSLKTGDQDKLLKWIKIRPAAERAQIMDMLEPVSGKLNPLFFLTFAHWSAAADDVDKAVFWHFMARFRLRYDALRCGSPNAVDNMDGLLALMPEGKIAPTVAKQDRPALMSYLQRVLDYDAAHPAENSPKNVCVFINNLEGRGFVIVQERYWQNIRHSLRRITEAQIEKMKAEGVTPAQIETKKTPPVPEETETPKPE